MKHADSVVGDAEREGFINGAEAIQEMLTAIKTEIECISSAVVVEIANGCWFGLITGNLQRQPFPKALHLDFLSLRFDPESADDGRRSV